MKKILVLFAIVLIVSCTMSPTSGSYGSSSSLYADPPEVIHIQLMQRYNTNLHVWDAATIYFDLSTAQGRWEICFEVNCAYGFVYQGCKNVEPHGDHYHDSITIDTEGNEALSAEVISIERKGGTHIN